VIAPTLVDSVPDTRSVVSYFDAFAPAPEWHDLVRWPPDVFALANLVLDHTEAYRFVVAPPPGRRWPPFEEWEAQVKREARQWKESVEEPPPLVRACWDTVTRCRDVPLVDVRSGTAWELSAALLTLHALADEACVDVTSERRLFGDRFEARGWRLLQGRGSLSRLSPGRVRILPKTNFPPRGITIRSLSRYLGLCYEAVDVRWRGVEPSPSGDRRYYNILLLPWPLSIKATDFRPAAVRPIENMDPNRFAFFEFAPEVSLDAQIVGSLLSAAGPVDAVILPESAVDAASIAALENTLAEHDTTFLIAGVRERPVSALGRNYLHFGVRTTAGWNRYEQDKHHRWCLDEQQIRQYHLTRSLHPKKLWWEAIDLRERRLHIIDVGGRITTAPMVCEDLASLDEVADHVRRIGPSLVVAVLLDGPQLTARWPSRYSSIMTDDPGSAVLTLTSFGMAVRSRPPGRKRSRVVAHWNSRPDGPCEIELARGAAGVLLRTAVEESTAWTADGRCHRDVPRLMLADVRQLHP
jgi:hypothetical protein